MFYFHVNYVCNDRKCFREGDLPSFLQPIAPQTPLISDLLYVALLHYLHSAGTGGYKVNELASYCRLLFPHQNYSHSSVNSKENSLRKKEANNNYIVRLSCFVILASAFFQIYLKAVETYFRAHCPASSLTSTIILMLQVFLQRPPFDQTR